MCESSPLKLHAPDVTSMRAIGAALASALARTTGPITIALEGELGAGKTTLVGAILKAFGFAGHARSPTYTLVEPYELADRAIYHLDLYRLTDPYEMEPLGLRDLQGPSAIFLIEWPDRAAGMLPPLDLTIEIGYADEAGRDIGVSAHSERGRTLLLALTVLTKA